MEGILGYDWEEIQARQQGKYSPRTVDPNSTPPQATQADTQLLNEKGLTYLQDKGLFGVLDRLCNSGHVDRKDVYPHAT